MQVIFSLFYLLVSHNASVSHFLLSTLLTWSSRSNPGALPYPLSPAQGDRGSAPPLMSSEKDKTLPSSPCSARHDLADREKWSVIEPGPGPMLCPLGLDETSWAGRGSGGLGGGGELGVGKCVSSGTKGSGWGFNKCKIKIQNYFTNRLVTLMWRIVFRCIVGTYFQCEQRHRRALWDSCRSAACHYTLWIYRSGTK